METGSCTPLPPTGGYECDFVDPIPESLSCAVCLLPFRDPHLVSCCGTKFCAPCISKLKAAGQPCPVCVQEFTSLLDRGYQRKVLNLKVVCSRKKDGCQWVGELHDLDHHEREECEWAVVECSYQCGAHLPRRPMAKHERDLCPQRPINVKLECFMKNMEKKLKSERKRHESELAAVREEFRKEVNELKQLIESKMVEQKKETGKNISEPKEKTFAFKKLKRNLESRQENSDLLVYVSENEDDDEEVVEGADISKQVTAKRHKGEKSIGAATEDAAQHSSIVPLVSYDEIILDVSTVSFGTLQTIAIDVQVERDGVSLGVDYYNKSMTLKLLFSDIQLWKMSLDPSSCAIVLLLSPISSRGLEIRMKTRFCVTDGFWDSSDLRVDNKNIVIHLNRSPDQFSVKALLNILEHCHESQCQFSYQVLNSKAMETLLESLKPVSSPKPPSHCSQGTKWKRKWQLMKEEMQ